jgi:hypothetical protein
MESDVSHWVSRFKAKYSSEFKHSSKENSLISQSDALLREFGVKSDPYPKGLRRPKRPRGQCSPFATGSHVNAIVISPVESAPKPDPIPAGADRPSAPARDELEDEIAEIEHLLNEMKGANVPCPVKLRQPDLRHLSLLRVRPLFLIWRMKSKAARCSRPKSDSQLRVAFGPASRIPGRSPFATWQHECQQRFLALRDARMLQKSMSFWRARFEKVRRQSRLSELYHAKDLERRAIEFAEQRCVLRYFRIWLSKRGRLRTEQEKNVAQPPIEKPRVHLKRVRWERKPRPPPIVPNPIGEQLLQSALGAKEKRVQGVKEKMRLDKWAKQQRDQQEMEALERQRKEHRRELLRQKKAREALFLAEQAKIQDHRQYQQKNAMAEGHSKIRMLRKLCRRWARILEFRVSQIVAFRTQFATVVQRRYFTLLRTAFDKKDHARLKIALEFNRKRIFRKVRLGIGVASQILQEHAAAVVVVHRKYTLKGRMQEWRDAKTIRRRTMKQRAIDFSQKRIILRAWKALPAGLAAMREMDHKRDFTKKMMAKAQQYLQMNQSLTITTGTLDSQPLPVSQAHADPPVKQEVEEIVGREEEEEEERGNSFLSDSFF